MRTLTDTEWARLRDEAERKLIEGDSNDTIEAFSELRILDAMHKFK